VPAFVLAFAMASPLTGLADVTKDLGVAGRALSFLENGPHGSVEIGVVFDPSKPSSVAEKNALMGVLGSGYSAGALTLTGKPIELSGIGGASGLGALYVTTGVNYAAVGAAAKAKKLITISSDLACVKAGECVMSVSTDPKVAIIVNHAAAEAVGATFKAAFRMMIQEV
jgi:hypothetical protein